MQLTSLQKRSLAWLGIGFLLLGTVWLLAPVLAPFVVAAVLAYALTPLVDWLDARFNGWMPRVLVVVLVELLLLLMGLGLILLIIPILSKELPLMKAQLPILLDSLSQWLSPWLGQFGVRLALDVESVKQFAFKYLDANFEDALLSVLSSLKLGGSVALALVGNVVLIPVVLFYLLMDWGRFVKMVEALVPLRLLPGMKHFVAEADEVLGQYFRGQVLVMLVLSLYYCVGLALFGLDLAVPIGLFTGLAIFVPYLGFGLGLVLATLAGVLQFASLKALLMVAVVYGVGQLVESFYLTPRLVGERIGLHPLAVIFALLAFGQVFGFVGVLIALPAGAVLLVAARRLRDAYLGSPLYRG